MNDEEKKGIIAEALEAISEHLSWVHTPRKAETCLQQKANEYFASLKNGQVIPRKKMVEMIVGSFLNNCRDTYTPGPG